MFSLLQHSSNQNISYDYYYNQKPQSALNKHEKENNDSKAGLRTQYPDYRSVCVKPVTQAKIENKSSKQMNIKSQTSNGDKPAGAELTKCNLNKMHTKRTFYPEYENDAESLLDKFTKPKEQKFVKKICNNENKNTQTSINANGIPQNNILEDKQQMFSNELNHNKFNKTNSTLNYKRYELLQNTKKRNEDLYNNIYGSQLGDVIPGYSSKNYVEEPLIKNNIKKDNLHRSLLQGSFNQGDFNNNTNYPSYYKNQIEFFNDISKKKISDDKKNFYNESINIQDEDRNNKKESVEFFNEKTRKKNSEQKGNFLSSPRDFLYHKS